MKGRCVRPSWMLMGTGLAFLPAYGYKNEAVCEDSIKDQIKTLSESKSLDQKTKTFIKQSLNIYNDYSNGRDIHATDIKKLKTLGNQILHDNFNSTIPRQLGYGFVLGYTTGFCVRRAFRIFSLAIGGYFIISQSFAYSGFKSIEIEKTIHDIENLPQSNIAKKIMTFYHSNLPAHARYHLPTTSSFAVGFILGFRK